MSFSVTLPSVTAIDLAPNPTTFNSPVHIAVTIIEMQKELEPYNYCCGEIYAGEA